MSEEDTQHSYVETEVLIDSARVLSSTFPTIGVALTGNELEILRNILNYATRRRTFVGVYHDNYYLVADDDDWLEIEETVANLEEKLMGNENTIFGYNNRLFTREDHTMLADVDWVQNHDAVPEGEVWIVTGISFFSSKTDGSVTPLAAMPTVSSAVGETVTYLANVWNVASPLYHVLKEDDHISMSWKNLVNTQRIISNVTGFVMLIE